MPKIGLIILDGLGLRDDFEYNAVKNARTPNLDRIIEEWGMTRLLASEGAVGLPSGQMGNSEVGHMAIGSGRVVYQDLALIAKEIKDGSFYKKEVFKDFFEQLKNSNGSLNLMGLLSKGGVHSHMDHLKALLILAKSYGIKAYVHAFTDGRDVATDSSLNDIPEIIDFMKENDIGELSSISGRYYAMDRDKRWERTNECYRMLIGETKVLDISPIHYIKEQQKKSITDEFYPPQRFSREGSIKEGDGIIFFNFRPDRARQLTRAFAEEDFNEFKREFRIESFLTMTEYDKSYKTPKVIYKKEEIINTLSEILSKNNLKQLKIAETEKYAHVTFFLNGGREEPFKGEDRILIPSPKVKTYDECPKMSAYEVSSKLIDAIKEYDFFVVNLANPDMVGHTGDYEATIKAIEACDECVGEIYNKMMDEEGILLITSDHGNSEEMAGVHKTTHTINPVFFMVAGRMTKLKEGGLSDIAPTILDLLDIPKPKEMTGESLIGG